MLYDNSRLRPQMPDPNSPPMPPSSVMRKYADPKDLPSPDGTVEHDGTSWTKFGRSEVPINALHIHQEAREHWLRQCRGRMATKGGSTWPTASKVPAIRYRMSRTRPTAPREQDEAKRLEPYPSLESCMVTPTDPPAHPIRATTQDIAATADHPARTLVTVPINQGAVFGNAGTVSAATMYKHEGMHAAQGPASRESKAPLGGWKDGREQGVITKGDNVAALAHGETGRRDDYGTGTRFETSSFTSAEPSHPQAAAAIAQAKPDLER